MSYTKLSPKKNYAIFWNTLRIVVVVSIVIFASCVLSDATTAPILAITGATADQIKESSNSTFLTSIGLGLILLPLFIGILGFLMLKYLESPSIFENGLFGIPYKRDICGNLEYE